MDNNVAFTDEDLCKAARLGDREAEAQLAHRYGQLVKACARPYFLAGGDSEDLIQEGMFGLLSAMREYDPQKNVPFELYAQLCIKRRLYSAVRSAASSRHYPLNNFVSFENMAEEGNVLPAQFAASRDIEDAVIGRESADEITKVLSSQLSTFEEKVLKLYLKGFSYSSIAQALSKSSKSVDNAIQRIRKKLVAYLNNGEIS